MKALLVVLLFSACSASAQSWHPFGSVDYLGVGNLRAHASSDVNSACSAALSAGATSCSASEDVYGAFGARVGAYYALGPLDIGPSLGYLYGGPGASKDSLMVTPPGAVSGTVTDDTFRFLLQGKEMIAGDSHLRVTLDAGLGLAIIKEDSSCADSGSLTGACASITPTTTTGWATWELGPSLWVEQFQFALHYVGFARGGDLPWNTVGLSIGVEL